MDIYNVIIVFIKIHPFTRKLLKFKVSRTKNINVIVFIRKLHKMETLKCLHYAIIH